MERNVGNSVEYWLSIGANLKKALYPLRAWNHLQIAFEGQLIWVRGMHESEINSVQILALPSANRYYLKGAKLYFYGKQLPEQIEPSLLWTPIQRALPLSLPALNFNYFGLDQKHNMTVIPANREVPTTASIVDLEQLSKYTATAPAIRFLNLEWTVLGNQKALIIGTPILPISGEDYYQDGHFLIKAGWKIKFDNMRKLYEESLPHLSDFWYIIAADTTFQKISKADFNTLNRGSVNDTVESLNNISELLDY